MCNKDIFMIADPPNGRVHFATVNLHAGDLVFGGGQLTLHLSHDEPADPAARANWLPRPRWPVLPGHPGLRPGESILDGTYQFPDVIRTVT